jgi:hypothetical protein
METNCNSSHVDAREWSLSRVISILEDVLLCCGPNGDKGIVSSLQRTRHYNTRLNIDSLFHLENVNPQA